MSDPKVQLTGNIICSNRYVDWFTTAPSSYLECVSSCEFTRPFHRSIVSLICNESKKNHNLLGIEAFCGLIWKTELFCKPRKSEIRPLTASSAVRKVPSKAEKALCCNNFSCFEYWGKRWILFSSQISAVLHALIEYENGGIETIVMKMRNLMLYCRCLVFPGIQNFFAFFDNLSAVVFSE